MKLPDSHKLIDVKVSKDFVFRKKTIISPNPVVVEIFEEGDESADTSNYNAQRVNDRLELSKSWATLDNS